MMPLQRAWAGESQVRNKLSNGPLRAQSKAFLSSILRRVGIRQLPGICWYPDKCTAVMAVNQGGTAGKVYLFVLGRTIGKFCPRAFLFACDENSSGRKCQRSFLILFGGVL